MTQPLSPAAQAVLARISASDCVARGDYYYGQIGAAAIRALVEAKLPFDDGPKNRRKSGEVDYAMGARIRAQRLRAEFLAVADELELLP